jgi:hypothetical protein
VRDALAVEGRGYGAMSRVFVATAMSSSFVGTVYSREELDALVDRLTTSGFDRGDISLMASHDAVIRKLRAVYRDPVEIAEARASRAAIWLLGMISRAFPPSCSGRSSAPWARLFR